MPFTKAKKTINIKHMFVFTLRVYLGAIFSILFRCVTHTHTWASHHVEMCVCVCVFFAIGGDVYFYAHFYVSSRTFSHTHTHTRVCLLFWGERRTHPYRYGNEEKQASMVLGKTDDIFATVPFDYPVYPTPRNVL